MEARAVAKATEPVLMLNFWLMQKQSAQKQKSQKRYMKKEKFATQDKTKKCSHCEMASVITIPLGKSLRRLCGKHYAIYKNKNTPLKAEFTKASAL